MTVGTIGAEIQLAVPVLETLTLDSDAKVRENSGKVFESNSGITRFIIEERSKFRMKRHRKFQLPFQGFP
jgi:hypothetical protein